ncbi:MAG: L-histidine N(alpha)-methyltransferase [Phycisphaeraceae bacterium]
MTFTPTDLPLHDCAPRPDDLLADTLAGLRQSPKTLPCKLLYDQPGSELFDRICELPEYYPTRTEMAIMRDHIADMVRHIGERALLIELGSGSSTKTRILLDHLRRPAGYVPIDISREHLLRSAQQIQQRYRDLEVLPVCADYLQDFDVPAPTQPAARRVVYFPGSTIGNFHEPEARRFLQRIAELVTPGGGLLIGVDLRKDPSILVPAYNDAQGVTAAFNLNILHRLNREFAADIDVAGFEHRAVWNDAQGRIEMHLVARQAQEVTIADQTFRFEAGESIRTECSYKHTPQRFAELADAFDIQHVWTDPAELFSVQYLVAK